MNPIRFTRQIYLYLPLLEAGAIREDFRLDAVLWAKGVVELGSLDGTVLLVAIVVRTVPSPISVSILRSLIMMCMSRQWEWASSATPGEKSAIGLDLFYQALVFDTRIVTGSPNPTVNGTYRTTNHAGGATFRLNF